MPDHHIRLRAAWNLHYVDVESDASQSLSVNLPREWTPETRYPFQLVRQFGRPPVNPETEELFLVLRRVPGLLALRLNGRDLVPTAEDQTDYEIVLPGLLLPRNALLLRVGQAAAGQSWGDVALRISPRRVMHRA